MCELCSNFRDMKEYKSGQSETEEIFYDSKKNEYVLVLEQFRYEYAWMIVKYCPICGKKLR